MTETIRGSNELPGNVLDFIPDLKPEAGQIETATRNVIGASVSKKGQYLERNMKLFEIIRGRLTWEMAGDLGKLSAEDERQRDALVWEIVSGMALDNSDDAAKAVLSVDAEFIKETIRKLHRGVGKAVLGSAILINLAIEQEGYKSVYGCDTTAEFIRRGPELLDIAPSTMVFRDRMGGGFRFHHRLLLDGTGNEAGLTLDEIVSRHLSKLAFLQDVIAAVGHERALKAFKEKSFKAFVELAKAGKRKVSSSSAEKTQNAATNQKASPPAIEGFCPAALGCRRILLGGGRPYLLASKYPEALPVAIAALEKRYAATNNATRSRSGEIVFDVLDPLGNIAEYWSTANFFEIVDRIRSGLSLVGPARRTIGVLLVRLKDEPFFKRSWKAKYSSFAAFALAELGIGEELRDYLRVGRNLIAFPTILAGLDGANTDMVFYNLRHLKAAMLTHKMNVRLVRAKLVSMTTRDFAVFAKHADYDEKLASGKLSRSDEDKFFSYVSQINVHIDQGRTVEVVEVYTDSEVNALLNALRTEEARIAAERDTSKVDDRQKMVASAA